MKKILIAAVVGLLSVSALTARAGNMDHVLGRILLQVQENGEAWYVAPESAERVYIKNGDAAYAALRTFGLGITNADLSKIPIGIEDRFQDIDTDSDGLSDYIEEAIGTASLDPDSDADSFLDGAEVLGGYNPLGEGTTPLDVGLGNRLRGFIVLQVESRGEAWYIHPDNGMRYYMKNGDAAYQIMRYLSLGITNDDLASIPLFSAMLDCGESFSCLLSAVETDVAATSTMTLLMNISGTEVVTDMKYAHILPEQQGGLYTHDAQIIQQLMGGVPQEDLSGYHRTCTYKNKDDMAAVIKNWINLHENGTGTISTSEMDFATCVDVQ